MLLCISIISITSDRFLFSKKLGVNYDFFLNAAGKVDDVVNSHTEGALPLKFIKRLRVENFAKKSS